MDKKILVVDDAPYIRLLIEQCLEEFVEAGVALSFAEDGKSALSIIEREKPDLVFLDVMLPQMNGYEVCNTVKNLWGMSEVFVVMLTAKGQESDKSKGNALGADLYLTKPFLPSELIATTARILGVGEA